MLNCNELEELLSLELSWTASMFTRNGIGPEWWETARPTL
jgi:hypothetical protein